MKLKHIAFISSLFPILFSLVLFFGVLISADSDDENSNFSSGITGMNLSAEVLKHQPMVEKYARENGISEYVNVLLAIIQVESGGTAEDVMQSSESLGLPPNSLDTESSIKQGCKYFASLLSSCKNQGIDDLNVAIQSYNYGGGYVGYVAGKGKKHTFNLAESFAREKSGGKKVTYTNPIAVAKNGGWRYGYGNMFYVELVNQYLTVAHFDNAGEIEANRFCYNALLTMRLDREQLKVLATMDDPLEAVRGVWASAQEVGQEEDFSHTLFEICEQTAQEQTMRMK